MRDVYDWDGGFFLGQIAEAPETYNVVGNMNEFGLIIGETTYGGLADLQHQTGAKIDYGSLIWITLQRSKNAREAIKTIGELMATYGYASEGESFSIADQKEAWIMEIIGKGEKELGAVWVARMVPKGHVTGHANQARITTFPLSDPETCIYAADTITFAKQNGYYTATAPDEEFSFSDVYNPLTFDGARFCEARVWTFFGSLMGPQWAAQYLDYAQGYNLTNRMPLWVQPAEKVSLDNVFGFMRNHFEGSWLDMTGHEFSDVGAGYGYMGQRTHPLNFYAPDPTTSTPAEYVNERPIATPQTAWNFVGQARPNLPRELSGLLWFGVDDSSTTVRFPIYSAATEVPSMFAGKGAQDGVTAPVMQFNMQSAFTVFNLVANWAYGRWDVIYPEVLAKIIAKEGAYQARMQQIDAETLALHSSKGAAAAIALGTRYSSEMGNALVVEWGQYFGELFMRFRDGYKISVATAEAQPKCGCTVADAPYSAQWYTRIAQDTGDHYKVPAAEQLAAQSQQLMKQSHSTGAGGKRMSNYSSGKDGSSSSSTVYRAGEGAASEGRSRAKLELLSRR